MKHSRTLLLSFALVAGVTAQAQTVNPSIKGEITVWAWKDPVAGLKSLDAGFAKAYPNIKVTYVQKEANANGIYGQYKLAFAAGSGGPDVALIEDSNLQQFIQLGALEDLTNRVKPYATKMSSFKLNTAKKDSRYYAMPWDSGPVALYYRRDIFQKAGIDPNSLKTWDDYIKAAGVIKEKTGVKMLPLARAKNDARFFETLLWQQGSGYTTTSGAVSLDKDSRALKAATLIDTLVKNDVSADIESWTDSWYKAIADGQVATLPMASWMGGFLKSWIAPKSSGQWGVVSLPTFAGSNSVTSNDGGSQLAIWSQSKNKDAAWAYIEYHLGTSESAAQLYKATDFFPSMTSLYSSAMFNEADPYFGNQKVRSLFAQLAKKVPSARVYSSDYADMNSMMQIELQKMTLGRQDAKTTLSNAAKVIRDRTRRQ